MQAGARTEPDTTSRLDLLRRFEEQLDPAHPTAGPVDVTIIGYGEVSAVLKFADQPGYVFKRTAGFETDDEVAAFGWTIGEYCDVLRARGVDVVPTVCHAIDSARNGKVAYLEQPAMDPTTIGNAILRDGTDDVVRELIRAILTNFRAVFTPPAESNGEAIGIDGQISNWAWVRGGDGAHRAVYLDVGAPLIRRDGRELLDYELFGRVFPQPLRWYFKTFELQGVLDRFHSLNGVTIDMGGNFIKEGRADRVPLLLEELEAWGAGAGAHLDVRVPTVQEVEKFYSGDAWIWTYVLGARKLDRFVRTRIMRGRYAHILPGKITRR